MAGVNMSRQQKRSGRTDHGRTGKDYRWREAADGCKGRRLQTQRLRSKNRKSEVVCADERGCTDGISRIRR